MNSIMKTETEKNSNVIFPFFSKIVKFLGTLSKIAVVVIALVAGFGAGNLYNQYIFSIKASQARLTKTAKTTSIAVNERGEVMIIDRKTGSYEVYADSVGKMIFDLYAGRMYYESRNK